MDVAGPSTLDVSNIFHVQLGRLGLSISLLLLQQQPSTPAASSISCFFSGFICGACGSISEAFGSYTTTAIKTQTMS